MRGSTEKTTEIPCVVKRFRWVVEISSQITEVILVKSSCQNMLWDNGVKEVSKELYMGPRKYQWKRVVLKLFRMYTGNPLVGKTFFEEVRIIRYSNSVDERGV